MANRHRKSSAARIRLPAFPCPVCGERGLSNTVEPMSRLVRKLYYFCSNHACGHNWTCDLAYIATTSPSALGTVKEPAAGYRLKMRGNLPPIGNPLAEIHPPPDHPPPD